jgi:nicotinamide mononucleotide adenylyltransferase
MKNYIAKADKKTSSSQTQYSMFVGRWQPLHKGHQWLFQQALDDDKNVLICIRDVEPDEKNPFKPEEVKKDIENFYSEYLDSGRVKVIIIPDIESINYGRGVGYDIIEHIPPTDIHDISATKIREEMKMKGEL